MSKKEIRPMWTTVVDPSEYDYRKQFAEVVKCANHNKEIFPPTDIGKVWGLVQSHSRLEAENAALREEVATWRAVASAYSQLIQDAVSKSARKEAQP